MSTWFFLDIGQSRSAQIGPFSIIGNGTNIGDNTKISNSVIGERCTIGSNVSIEGSYIWDNVTIEDGCVLKHAIVCNDVIMKSGAVLEPGVILSFKVRVKISPLYCLSFWILFLPFFFLILWDDFLNLTVY